MPSLCAWTKKSVTDRYERTYKYMTVEFKKQPKVEVYCGDVLEVLKTLPSESVNCCVTSPPYFGLRDYGVDGQIGLEETPEEYVERLVRVFRQVRRVLRGDGTLWGNIDRKSTRLNSSHLGI